MHQMPFQHQRHVLPVIELETITQSIIALHTLTQYSYYIKCVLLVLLVSVLDKKLFYGVSIIYPLLLIFSRSGAARYYPLHNISLLSRSILEREI